MSGKLTKLPDLGKAFGSLQAEMRRKQIVERLEVALKKAELIAEFRMAFQRSGYPPSVCHALAEAKYKSMYGTR